jgi:hypothetical protein
MLSKETTKALDRLDALVKSLREYRLRKEAVRMGCSYWTRAKMQDPAFTPSNHVPWRILPKKTRRLFKRACTRPRPLRRQRREKESLLAVLGISTQ